MRGPGGKEASGGSFGARAAAVRRSRTRPQAVNAVRCRSNPSFSAKDNPCRYYLRGFFIPKPLALRQKYDKRCKKHAEKSSLRGSAEQATLPLAVIGVTCSVRLSRVLFHSDKRKVFIILTALIRVRQIQNFVICLVQWHSSLPAPTWYRCCKSS